MVVGPSSATSLQSHGEASNAESHTTLDFSLLKSSCSDFGDCWSLPLSSRSCVTTTGLSLLGRCVEAKFFERP